LITPWYSSTVILDRQSLWSAEILRILTVFFPFWGGRRGAGSGYGLMCMPVDFLEEIPGKRMAKSKVCPLTNFLVDIARLSFRRGNTNPLSKCGLIFRIHLRDLICFFQG